MPRHRGMPEGVMEDLLFPRKVRKRGCSSPASSSSSMIQNYRLKRTIVVGKKNGSGAPLPTWKLTRSPSSQNGGINDKHQQQQQQPVSARKLAAMLWEMNEIPSASVLENRRLRNSRPVNSGSFPPHLSDPSHSPVSERMDQSGTRSRRRIASSIQHQGSTMLAEHNIGVLDSASNASLMDMETRSRAKTPTEPIVAAKIRLKEVSNTLTTSKELLKIIDHIWGQNERPSLSMPLISALHTELERARLQVNQLIREQHSHSDMNEINYLIKQFSLEKTAWKIKEQAALETIIVEQKLRRRLERLNNKLGKELAQTKSSLIQTVKELEAEKRARLEIERVCEMLVGNLSEDQAEESGESDIGSIELNMDNYKWNHPYDLGKH
ncbi:hypothetical protein ACFE04_020560 [Oxalis oulophora]